LVGEKPVPIEKLDKQTWRIPANGTVTVRYDTYWDDGGPFGTELNTQSAFINPAMILMYVPQRRAEQVRVDVTALPEDWATAGGAAIVSFESGRLRVESLTVGSYDDLTDTPIQAGKIARFDVPDAQPPIHVVVLG